MSASLVILRVWAKKDPLTYILFLNQSEKILLFTTKNLDFHIKRKN